MLRAALDAAAHDAVTACDLPNLPPGALLRGLTPPPGWSAALSGADHCPVLVIPSQAHGLEGFVPHRMRRKLRMNRHRAGAGRRLDDRGRDGSNAALHA